MSNRDLMTGFVRLHVLTSCEHGPNFRHWHHRKACIPRVHAEPRHPVSNSPRTAERWLLALPWRNRRKPKTANLRNHGHRSASTDTQPSEAVGVFKEVFEKELSPDTAGHVEKAFQVAMAKASRPPAIVTPGQEVAVSLPSPPVGQEVARLLRNAGMKAQSVMTIWRQRLLLFTFSLFSAFFPWCCKSRSGEKGTSNREC